MLTPLHKNGVHILLRFVGNLIADEAVVDESGYRVGTLTPLGSQLLSGRTARQAATLSDLPTLHGLKGNLPVMASPSGDVR